jgi:hypothetical protein
MIKATSARPQRSEREGLFLGLYLTKKLENGVRRVGILVGLPAALTKNTLCAACDTSPTLACVTISVHDILEAIESWDEAEDCAKVSSLYLSKTFLTIGEEEDAILFFFSFFLKKI